MQCKSKTHLSDSPLKAVRMNVWRKWLRQHFAARFVIVRNSCIKISTRALNLGFVVIVMFYDLFVNRLESWYSHLIFNLDTELSLSWMTQRLFLFFKILKVRIFCCKDRPDTDMIYSKVVWLKHCHWHHCTELGFSNNHQNYKMFLRWIFAICTVPITFPVH